MVRNLRSGLRQSLKPSIAGGLGDNDIFTTASLDLNFAKYKNLGTVDATTGQNLIDHTRASSGTYVGSDGLIKTATTNLLRRSEEFENASWLKTRSSVTANAITAPNGMVTADKIVEDNSASLNHIVYASALSLPSNIYIFSCYAKSAERSELVLRLDTNVAQRNVFFNLDSGSIGAASAGVQGSISPVGNGWYRCSLVLTSAESLINAVVMLAVDGSSVYTGDGTSGIYLWGAQLEQSSTVGEYIPTTSTINSAPRFDHDPTTGESLGLLVEEQRTNSIRNNTMVGAVAGTPGTLPTNWSTNGFAGITQQVVGSGTLGSVSYVDIRFSGTANGGFGNIFTETSTQIATINSDIWSHSLYAQIVAGSLANINSITVRGIAIDSGGSTIGGGAIDGTQAGVFDATYKRISNTTTINSASAAYIRPYINFAYVNGSVIDFTVRIAGNQLEKGSFPTSYIPTEGTTVTRAADVASITGANFSSWYRQDEGTVFAHFVVNGDKGSNQFIYDIAGGNAIAEEIFALKSPATNNTGYAIRSNGIVQAAFGGDGQSGFATQIKSALGASASSTNVAVNGALQTEDPSVTMPTVNNLVIGRRSDGSFLGDFSIRRLTYWPQRLPNATLQTITT